MCFNIRECFCVENQTRVGSIRIFVSSPSLSVPGQNKKKFQKTKYSSRVNEDYVCKTLSQKLRVANFRDLRYPQQKFRVCTCTGIACDDFASNLPTGTSARTSPTPPPFLKPLIGVFHKHKAQRHRPCTSTHENRTNHLLLISSEKNGYHTHSLIPSNDFDRYIQRRVIDESIMRLRQCHHIVRRRRTCLKRCGCGYLDVPLTCDDEDEFRSL